MNLTPYCLALSLFVIAACSPQAGPASAGMGVDGGAQEAPNGSNVVGEVPQELLDTIFEKVIEDEGIDRGEISVDRAESVIWPDGSLGCPRPGEMYTQAPVDGYWIVLKAGERQFDYRTSVKGEIRRCDVSHRLQLPVG
jgi:hypothetical protein